MIKNTTKNVRKIARQCMESCDVRYGYRTWTDRQYFADDSRKERYVTFAVYCSSSDVEQNFLDCVNRNMLMNGITDCKPRMVNGYLRMNSFIG